MKSQGMLTKLLSTMTTDMKLPDRHTKVKPNPTKLLNTLMKSQGMLTKLLSTMTTDMKLPDRLTRSQGKPPKRKVQNPPRAPHLEWLIRMNNNFSLEHIIDIFDNI